MNETIRPETIGSTTVRRDGRVAGKVALVTGAATGLGEAIATLLAAEGAAVAVTDRDPAGKAVVEAIVTAGGQAHFWALDVTDEAAVETVMAEVVGEFGRLDVLVNNAGIPGPDEPADQVSLAAWEQVFRVNVGGPFLCTKYAVPHMRRSPGQSSIVNISSIYGIIGNADSPVYHSSKGAVRLASKTDAVTYAPEGIRVNSVHPGTMLTALNIEKGSRGPGGLDGYLEQMRALHPLGMVGEPSDIAYGVLYLASDESRFVTGSELVIDGGYTAQ